jgi:hypothetical protein
MATFNVTILCHSDGQSEIGCVGQHLKYRSLNTTRRSHDDIVTGTTIHTEM